MFGVRLHIESEAGSAFDEEYWAIGKPLDSLPRIPQPIEHNLQKPLEERCKELTADIEAFNELQQKMELDEAERLLGETEKLLKKCDADAKSEK